MALSKPVLSSLMQSKIAAIPGISITQPAELKNFCDAVSDAIVTHIVAAAIVNSVGADPQGGTVSSVGTVT